MAASHPLTPAPQDAIDARPTSAVSSSQQRRHDALGGAITVRAPSSAGNSVSSRSIRNPGTGKETGMTGSDQFPNVRTLPTWVQKRDEEESVRFPPTAHRRPPERSIHDGQRETTPVTPSHPSQHANRWKDFVEFTGTYPPNTSHSEKVDRNWLAEQGDLNTPWLNNHRGPEAEGDGAADDQEALFVSKKKRQIWYKRIHIILLNSPMVPLTFRAILWTFSLIALALAGSIFHLSRVYGFAQKPSTIMAIAVDAIALGYLIYITWDEYSGKPVGLRSPKAKIRLIMLDLLFIVFDSANLSLAFDTLYDVRWSCRSVSSSSDGWEQSSNSTRTVDPICDRQRALAAFLFLALCAWVATFMVSIFRVVERVSSSR
ncbi:hypothetical protein EDC01DRAFT_671451 [Geopyxis carbonaria]|nr:hypothetical protein EDC01DRAFT_671451 [Geopyxis carbonaria]